MDEIKLLNETLDILVKEDEKRAYAYIKENISERDYLSSQAYNYLYCLASLCGLKDEAISWLKEAIVQKGYWYRPEVFEDEDLDFIREDKRFDEYVSFSKEKYLLALKNAKTICTWQEHTGDDLYLVLHGNQENNEISKKHWGFLNQVEYVQSEELDSAGFYRWSDDGNGAEQLRAVIKNIDYDNYEKRVLCGFSAGCNVILKALSKGYIKCDGLILQSPWIPVIEDDINEVINALKNLEITLVCGKDDEDCYESAQRLFNRCVDSGIKIKGVFVDGLGHEFTKNLSELI